MTVRTRFAPSPTGGLHLGNARIAVLNWLYARHEEGRFIIRIEDTDVERNVPGSEEQILASLRRLRMTWDEGPDRGGPHAPYRQSERVSSYRDAAEKLIAEGKAYRCYCTPEELESKRQAALAQGANPRYDGTCRNLSPEQEAKYRQEGRPGSIRFQVEPGAVVIEDLARGPIRFAADEFGDFVIVKSDGLPTYNFAVVVDDLAMEVSHVIRGVGHLANTPRQDMLYRALGAESPTFVHVPHVLGPDGTSLSKRHGATTLQEYLDAGYHPDALINYLSLLSWSSPGGEEVLSPERLIDEIDLSRIGVADVKLDPEKLEWLSGEHIRRMVPEELARELEFSLGPDALPRGQERRTRLAAAIQERISTFKAAREFLPQLDPPDPMEWTPEARKALQGGEAGRILSRLRVALSEFQDWDGERVMDAVRSVGEELGVKGRALFMPVRAAVTGATGGPELADVFEIQGHDTVLRVLDQALAELRAEGGG